MSTARPHGRPTIIAACVAVGIAATACQSPSSVEVSETRVRVTRVVDGDTVDVADSTGTRQRVRVLGIDAPESTGDRPRGCWGPVASRWATRTLTGRTVVLRGDASQAARDRYGRVLAHVLVDGTDFAVTAAAAGMARRYVYGHRPVANSAAIAAAEDSARRARRGLWGPPCNGR